MKVAILDGYVDEPSCLGVPPYIAPYPRYIYGMLKHFGVNPRYFTIDQIRGREFDLEKFDLVIIIAGIAVPGKYLGGNPLSVKDLKNLANLKVEKILVGPITLEIDDKDRRYLEEFYEIVDYPFERKLLEILAKKFNKSVKVENDRNFVNRYALLGAEVVKQHPDFPYVICEIETYKGCYWRRCSFCVERFHKLEMRNPKWVIAEIKALYDNGVRYFRLGNQTDFFTYMADFRYEIPKPDPEFMRSFHRAIWESCPRIRTLHLDNVNPKTIAVHPEESREVIKIIVAYQTPGNVGAMGLESADERVVRENNLCATPEEVKFAIKLVNEFRSIGYNGLPCFLPGINFVIGLKGETKKTFERNYEFLRELLDEDLWVRRINIRQVKVFRGTPMEKVGYKNVLKHKKYFKVFKERVRREIDREMLKRIVPTGRKLTDLRCELKKGKVTFARQLATYPLLVGIIGEYERNTVLDARVIDYGRRSITALPILNPNTAKLYQLEAIPGIGKTLAGKIIANRPYKSLEDLKAVLGEVFNRVVQFFEI